MQKITLRGRSHSEHHEHEIKRDFKEWQVFTRSTLHLSLKINSDGSVIINLEASANTTTAITGGGPLGSVSRDDESVSEQLRQVRTAALALLGKAEATSSTTDMATAVEKAAAVLQLAVEIGKAQADLAKLNGQVVGLERANKLAPKRERSERIGEYIAALAPLVAIITLAATLFAQSWQFLRSERSKREDALSARWQDAVKTNSASGALSPAIVSLQPFADFCANQNTAGS